MMNSSQAGSAANDVVGMFFLLASVALVLAGDGRTPALVLAAVAAGLAIGTKLSMVAPALALAVGMVAIAPRGRRGTTASVWLAALVLAGGYWYARNLIAVGNPLPWSSLGILPTPAAPLQQHTGFAVAHYLTSSMAWKDFFEPGLAAGLARWWTVILAFAVVGPVLCLLPGAGRTVRMLGLVALVSLAAYLITPETAAGPAGDPAGFAFNLRYAAPALALCFAVLPLAPAFDGPGRQSRAGRRARHRAAGDRDQGLAVAAPARPRDRARRRRPVGGGRRAGGDERSGTGSPARGIGGGAAAPRWRRGRI